MTVEDDLNESDDPDGLRVRLAVGVYKAEKVKDRWKYLLQVGIFHLLHVLTLAIKKIFFAIRWVTFRCLWSGLR